MRGFTVLLYHRVHPEFGVKPEVFEEQVKFLKRHFRILRLEELPTASRFPSALITFDDGFSDVFFYAYPILKRYNVPAVLFVPPERVFNSDEVRGNPKVSDISTFNAFRISFLNGDNTAFLSWGELKAVSDLIDVQSHALSHRAAVGKGKPFKPKTDWRVYSLSKLERKSIQNRTKLTSILVNDYKEAEVELRESKRILEEKLNKGITALAWPWGIYNKEIVKKAQEIGYKFCFTTERGWNRNNFRYLKRLAVSEKKCMFWFKTRSLLYAL